MLHFLFAVAFVEIAGLSILELHGRRRVMKTGAYVIMGSVLRYGGSVPSAFA